MSFFKLEICIIWLNGTVLPLITEEDLISSRTEWRFSKEHHGDNKQHHLLPLKQTQLRKQCNFKLWKMCTNHDRIYSIHVQSVELLYVVFFFSKGQFIWHKIVFQLQRIKLQKLFANFTLQIWIFFSKQSIYLVETTVQRNKPQETKSQKKLAWIYSAFVKI